MNMSQEQLVSEEMIARQLPAGPVLFRLLLAKIDERKARSNQTPKTSLLPPST